MRPLRRAASALLALGLALGAFTASPAPVRAEESGGELGAVVFGFDFSPSIFCTHDADVAGCVPIGLQLAESVDALADYVNTDASREVYKARNIAFRVVEFGKEARVITHGSEVCVGTTGTDAGLDLLVHCLQTIATDYRGEDSPAESLQGTRFEPVLREVMPPLGGRCGLIVFTDGEPEDDAARSQALKVFGQLESQNGHCAVLPIATGDISAEGITFLESITLDELADSPYCQESATQKFTWPTVYFEYPEQAVRKIREAFAYVACAPIVPEAPVCITVGEYKELLASNDLSGVSDFEDSYYVVGAVPGIGQTTSREIPVQIIGATQTEKCGGASPTPTEPPDPTETYTPPCIADSPVSWLGCNPWWLLLLLGLVVARLLWIRREIEVSVSGQTAVGLGNGPWNGFDVYSGDARMNLNPRADSIQIHRSFVRSARFEDRRSPDSTGTKTSLRMDDEITLQDGVRFTVGYGAGGSDSGGSGESFTSSGSGQSSSGSSSASSKELEW